MSHSARHPLSCHAHVFKRGNQSRSVSDSSSNADSRSSLTMIRSKLPAAVPYSSSLCAALRRLRMSFSLSVPRPRSRCSSKGMLGGAMKRNLGQRLVLLTCRGDKRGSQEIRRVTGGLDLSGRQEPGGARESADRRHTHITSPHLISRSFHLGSRSGGRRQTDARGGGRVGMTRLRYILGLRSWNARFARPASQCPGYKSSPRRGPS